MDMIIIEKSISLQMKGWQLTPFIYLRTPAHRIHIRYQIPRLRIGTRRQATVEWTNSTNFCTLLTTDDCRVWYKWTCGVSLAQDLASLDEVQDDLVVCNFMIPSWRWRRKVQLIHQAPCPQVTGNGIIIFNNILDLMTPLLSRSNVTIQEMTIIPL